MNDYQVVKDKIDIVGFIGKSIKLTNKGNKWLGLCPFHEEKTPSFYVSPEKQMYKCFGCGKGGDIFQFVIEQKIAFTKYDALQILAKEVGHTISKKKNDEFSKEAELQKVFDDALQFYCNNFGEKAKEYLQSFRKRDLETIKKFQYGFCGSGKYLYHELKQKYSDEILIASGLVIKKENKIYDYFLGERIIYPMFFHGRVSTFVGKDYWTEEKSYKTRKMQKTLNDCLFYGQDAIYGKEFILVEGEEDRIAVMQFCKIPAVAVQGELSALQIDFIEKTISEDTTIYLAFDNDASGHDKRNTMIETFAGIYDVRVLEWEIAKDLDEYLRNAENPKKEMASMLKHAEDSISFMISELPDMKSMDPRKQERLYQPIIDLIIKIDNDIAVSAYLEAVCEKLGSKTVYMRSLRKHINREKGIEEQEQEEVPQELIKFGMMRGNNHYYYLTDKYVEDITNFLLDIKRIAKINDELHYEVQLFSKKGIPSNIISFSPEECVNLRHFKKKIKSVGPFHFIGRRDSYLSEMWMIEEERAGDVPVSTIYQKFGYIPEDDLWLFDNCAVQNRKVYKANKDGMIDTTKNLSYQSRNVRVYSNDAPVMNLEFEADKKYVHEMIEHFWIMFDHKIGNESKDTKYLKTFDAFLALGYVAALAYRHHLIKELRQFPHLQVYGPKETGKSEAVRLLFKIFGFAQDGEPFDDATPHGINLMMHQLSGLPCWLEEFRLNVKYFEQKIAIMRNSYGLAGSGKGGLNQIRQILEVNTNLLLTGQNRVNDSAASSRFVVIRKDKPSPIASESFWHLFNESNKLSSIFLYLLKTMTPAKISEFTENVKRYKVKISEKIKANDGEMESIRSLTNHAIFAAGFEIFDFMDEKLQLRFVNFLANRVSQDIERVSQHEIIYEFFNSIESSLRGNMYNYIKKKNGTVYLVYKHIYDDWMKARKNTGVTEMISEHDLRDYLKNHPNEFYIHLDRDENRKPISGYRSIALEIEKLPPEIKDIVDGWDERE